MPHIIKDSIHKDIEVSDLELEVLDSPGMQRLRRIKQLGMTSLVYPCATHTRFEHSLGAMHVAGNICNSLGFGKQDTAHVRIAALLHDIGHFPFSHVLDEKGPFAGGKTHAGMGAERILNGFGGILSRAGLNPKEVAQTAAGKGKFGSLLSGGIDIDKMDYLVRDGHFTGVAYGMVDLTRLYYTARFNSGLAFDAKALRNIEAVVVSRFMMFQSVYFHPTIRCADAMLIRAVEDAVEKKIFTAGDVMQMDDIDLLGALRKSKSEFISLIDSRHLYKIASEIQLADLGESARKKIAKFEHEPKKQRELSGAIAEKLGLKGNEVLISISSMKPLEPVKIITNDETLELKQVSSFARSVMEQDKTAGSILVCVPEKHREKAEGAGKILIGLI